MEQCKAVTGRKLKIMCLLLMMMCGRSSADLADETTTLLGLKQAWGNPEELSSWSTNTRNSTCRSWVGVMCDPATKTVVQVLNVSRLELTGSIPDTLGNLTSLRIFDLSYNNLNGSIPETLGSLSSLQVIDLTDNYFDGSIPDTLGNLSSLQTLDLSYNNFNGFIPETLGSLSSLQVIDLTGKYLDGSIPDTLGNLSSLRTLDLFYNNFNGSIPETLGSLSSLQVIDFSGNLFDGFIPDTLGNLGNLGTLNLGSNNMKGSIPDRLGNIAGLQALFLSYNNLAGSIPVTFENLTSIQNLDLRYNALKGPIPETLGNWGANLAWLKLNDNKLGGIIPEQLGNLSMLQYLYLSDNSLQGPIPETLGNLAANLLRLDLHSNELYGPIPPALGNITVLRYLYLEDNTLVGSIPGTLENLGATLLELDLSFNSLQGPIPKEFGNLSMLQYLDLSINNLQGPIPKEFGNLSMLQYLYLNSDNLTGPIPVQLTGLANLLELHLSGNELNGSIPETIENLIALQSLWLDNNFLSGGIPQNYFAIPNLTSLRAANNNLSGPIPTQFSLPALLQELDLHGNFFTGEVPDSLVALHPPLIHYLHNNCLNGTRIQDNILTNANFEENCFDAVCKCDTVVPKVERKGKKSAKIIFITTGVDAGVLLVFSMRVVVIVCKRKSFIVTCTQRVPGSVQHYTLMEVIEATENYTKKIGEGGFSTVYKADFRDGTVAAVKHFNKKKPEESFWQEVDFLANLNHRNLVNLIGYCNDRGELMLMFDFMNRGSLWDTLHGSSSNPPLTWAERATILMNVARGIEYLHFGATIQLIHRDIKSANILLSDSMGKTLIAKVADFGLGKQTVLDSYEAMPVLGSDELQQTPLDNQVAGTPGYMDPGYMSASHLSPKVDVFSYGVVILELVTGRKAIFPHNQETTALVEWAKPYLEGNQIVTIMDPKLGKESIPEAQLVSVAGLVRRCIDNDSQNRPTIREVLKTLAEIFCSESAETRALFSREHVSNTGRSRAAALRRMKVLFPTVSLGSLAGTLTVIITALNLKYYHETRYNRHKAPNLALALMLDRDMIASNSSNF